MSNTQPSSAVQNTPTKAPEEKVFEVYTSSKQAHRIITPAGKTLHVINYQLITDNADDIEFLDAEIKAGFPYLKKGKAMTSAERDPMFRLKQQMKAEALAEINATANSGDSNSDAAKPAISPASSAKLAATAGSSLSK